MNLPHDWKRSKLMQRDGNSEGFPLFSCIVWVDTFLSVSWSLKAIAGICTVANPINMCYMTYLYITYHIRTFCK